MKKQYKAIIGLTIALLTTVGAIVPTSAAVNLGPVSTYIVRTIDGMELALEVTSAETGGVVKKTFGYAVDGFTVELPDSSVPFLLAQPGVLSVEKDAPMGMLAVQQVESPTPSWGIDRIDQRTTIPASDPAYKSAYGYRSAGAGSTIYIVDTGVYPHADFGNRLSQSGYTGFADGNGTSDCYGHGTHVASTAAGTQYGIAKNATIVPVRVLSCAGSGSVSGVIAGLDWILSPMNTNSHTQAVVNMSLGGAASGALDEAIGRITNAGMTMVVSAGNENSDACTRSPARAPSAITVGATDRTDAKASYSNFGTCVDINAPGTSITGAWITNSTSTNTISGTSMAAPHVTGAAAVYYGLNPSASVAQVAAYLDAASTKDVLTGLAPNTPNKLLYVSPTDDAPVVVAPTVALKGVAPITSTTATLTFDVTAGNAPTTLSLDYSTDASLVTGIMKGALAPSTFNGAAVTTSNASLANLLPNTQYYFRVTATNESGSIQTPIGSFRTAVAPATKATLTTIPATSITTYGAHLAGTAIAGNATTTVNFVYGTDPAFLLNTVTSVPTSGGVISGTSPVTLALDITNLRDNTQYYYKLVATNSAGVSETPGATFTTAKAVGAAPDVTIDTRRTSPSSIVDTFTGTVNPHGQATSVRFLYGYEKSVTLGVTAITLPAVLNTDTYTVVAASVRGLTPGSGVYYRFEATNAAGKTLSPVLYSIVAPVAPLVNNVNTTSIKSDAISVVSMVNAGGSNTRINYQYSTDATFATGVVTVQGSPYALTNALNTNVTANLAGLNANTSYTIRTAIQAITGPAAGTWIYSQPITIKTLAVVAPTPTPTPTPTPVPTPVPSNPLPAPVTGGTKIQTIAFNSLTNREYGPAQALVAKSNSGLTVSFVSMTPNTCQILYPTSGPVVQAVYPVTGLPQILCIVAATQAGDKIWAAAEPVMRTFLWTKAAMKLTVTGTNTVNSNGAKIQVAATTVNLELMSGLRSLGVPVSVVSNTPATCAVSNVQISDIGGSLYTTFMISAISNGICSTTSSFAGSDVRLPTSTTWATTIKK